MLPYSTIDEEQRPTLVICNGDAGNMSYQQIDLAMIYAACGFNVVTFDWRGFGASSEFEMDDDYLCYTEMLEDYRAVLAAVKGQEEVDEDCIFLMGWSTGAYLSMITPVHVRGNHPHPCQEPPCREDRSRTHRARRLPEGTDARAHSSGIRKTYHDHCRVKGRPDAAMDGGKNLRRPPRRHVQEAFHIRKRRPRRDGRPVFRRHAALCRRDRDIHPGGRRAESI